MKKIIFVLGAALLSTGAFAQNYSGYIAPHFEWGVKAGLNLSTVTKGSDTKLKPGLVAGVFGEYVFNELIGVQAEVVYSMQGADTDFHGIEGKLNLDYINIPILAKIYVLPRLSVDLGPQFGFMVRSKANISVGGVTAEREAGDYFDLKKFDVSFGMGLSYKFNFGLDVSARYNLGLTKWTDGLKGGTGDAESKNGVIQIAAGYRF